MNSFRNIYINVVHKVTTHPKLWLNFYELSSCSALQNVTSLNLNMSLTPCYSKCGSGTGNFGSTWELVTNAELQASAQTFTKHHLLKCCYLKII